MIDATLKRQSDEKCDLLFHLDTSRNSYVLVRAIIDTLERYNFVVFNY